MTRDEAIILLRENMQTIQKYGVKRIGLFGSVVRNEYTSQSDVDVVVEFEAGQGRMSNVIGLIDFLEELFGCEVDLLTPGGIKNIRIPYIRKQIEKELIYA